MDIASHALEEPDAVPGVGRRRRTLLAIGSMASIGAVGGTVQNLALYLSLDRALPQAQVDTILSLVLMGSLVGRLVMGWLADRWPRARRCGRRRFPLREPGACGCPGPASWPSTQEGPGAAHSRGVWRRGGESRNTRKSPPHTRIPTTVTAHRTPIAPALHACCTSIADSFCYRPTPLSDSAATWLL